MPTFGSYKFGERKFGVTTERVSGNGFFSQRNYYALGNRAAKFALPGEAILTNYGTLIGGVDMATQAVKNALEDHFVEYDLKLYIQDASSSPKWVDFSDKIEFRGKNQLHKIGQLVYSAERNIGATQQKLSTVSVDNSDRFWDKPFPSNLKATFDENFVFLSESDSASTWRKSKNNLLTSIHKHKVALRAQVRVAGNDVYEWITLGVFVIEDVSTSESNIAQIKLAPLSSALINTKADDVKDGLTWHQNKPADYLVAQLLKKEFSTSKGDLPTSFDIDEVLDIESPFIGTKGWASSSRGRPPEKTVSYANRGNGTEEWKDAGGLICEALCLWEYGDAEGDTKGSIILNPNSTTITGVGTKWTNGNQPPRVGDSFIIPKEFDAGDNGSTLGNEGKYVITSITSDTELTIDKHLKGEDTESHIKYCISRLFLGIGPTLYQYNPSTNVSYELTSSIAQIKQNFIIKQIVHNTRDHNYPLYFIVLSKQKEHTQISLVTNDSVDNGYSKIGHAHRQTMKVYKYNLSLTSPEILQLEDSNDDPIEEENVFSGEMIARQEHKFTDGSDNLWTKFYGNSYQEHYDSPNITIPFEQTIIQPLSYYHTNTGKSRRGVFEGIVQVKYFKNRGNHDATTENIRALSVSGVTNDDYKIERTQGPYHWGQAKYKLNTSTMYATQGYYVASKGFKASRSMEKGPIALRYTLGQTGNIVYNDTFGDKGGIFFVTMAEECDGIHTADGSGGTNGYISYTVGGEPNSHIAMTYCYYDLGQSNISKAEIDDSGNGSGLLKGVNISGHVLAPGFAEGSYQHQFNSTGDNEAGSQWFPKVKYYLPTAGCATIGPDPSASPADFSDPTDGSSVYYGMSFFGDQASDTPDIMSLIIRIKITPFYESGVRTGDTFVTSAIYQEDDGGLKAEDSGASGSDGYTAYPYGNNITFLELYATPNHLTVKEGDAKYSNHDTDPQKGRLYASVIKHEYMQPFKGYQAGDWAADNTETYEKSSDFGDDTPEGMPPPDGKFKSAYQLLHFDLESTFTYEYAKWYNSASSEKAPIKTSSTQMIRGLCHATTQISNTTGQTSTTVSHLYYMLCPRGIIERVKDNNYDLFNVATAIGRESLSTQTSAPGEGYPFTNLYLSRSKNRGYFESIAGDTTTIYKIQVKTAISIGDSSVDLRIDPTDNTAKFKFKAGDKFTIEGDRQIYEVTANASSTSGEISGLSFSPPAKEAWGATTLYPAMFCRSGFTSHMCIYWISAPVPKYTSDAQREGHFYLSHFAPYFSAYAELADFSGETIWSAIRQLAEMSNCKFGFRPDGNFFFKRKPRDQRVLYTFTNLSKNNIFSISKNQGLNEIVNISKRVPYRARLGDAEVSFNLIYNSMYSVSKVDDDEAAIKAVIDITQTDLETKEIKLICVQGGRTMNAGSNSGGDKETVEAMFSYRVFTETGETKLAGVYETSHLNKITLDTINNIKIGTSVTIIGDDESDPDDVKEKQALGSVGYKITYDTLGDLIVGPAEALANSALPNENDADTTGSETVAREDDYIPVTTETVDVDWKADSTNATNGRAILPGDILVIYEEGAEINYEYVTVQYVEQDKIYVARNTGGVNLGAVEHLVGSKIALIRNGFDVWLRKNPSAIYVADSSLAPTSFVVGDVVELAQKGNDSDSFSFENDSEGFVISPPSKHQFWIPIRNEFVTIGGDNTPFTTNIAMKIEYTGARSDEPDFSVGDIIRIKCPGLILEPHNESLKTALDVSSIDKWGKRENKAGKDNKYIDDIKALWLAKRDVNEEANPKFTYSLQTTLTPWLSMLDVVKVQDEYLNPNSLAHEEVGYISTISYDLNTRGLQTITVRGILPY